MPPAPALGSAELAYEMAEVYELALLRDEPARQQMGAAARQRANALTWEAGARAALAALREVAR